MALSSLGLIDNSSARSLLGGNADVTTSANRKRAIKVVDSAGLVLHNGVLADVLLMEQLQETGRLGKSWPSLQNLSAIQQVNCDQDSTDPVGSFQVLF